MHRAVSALILLLAACSGGTEEAAPLICGGLKSAEMVWVPGGTFTMGENPHYREEGPPRDIHVDGFWIDNHEITNDQFAEFVVATGYKTLAEQEPPKIEGAPPEMQVP